MKVPEVITTDFAENWTSMFVRTPVTVLFFMTNSFTESCHRYRLSVFSIISLHVWMNFSRSLCARGLHMAGPLERLSILNCIAVLSVTIPVLPPSASISRTICPFAIPPIAGLQLICAILFISIVMSRVFEPKFAAAQAASHPACPAPTTITSYLKVILLYLFINRSFFVRQKSKSFVFFLSHYLSFSRPFVVDST